MCGWRQESRAGRSWCVIQLRRVRERVAHCSGCLRPVEGFHDVEWRTVRDLPLFEHAVELRVKAFARKLRSYFPGILAHCRYPVHTSLLEGINNKIKLIKRMAYGFRDDEYFFLKIRAAFPGIG